MAAKAVPPIAANKRFGSPILFSLLLASLAQLVFTLELGVVVSCLLYLIAACVFGRSLRGHENDDSAAFGNGSLVADPGAKKRFEWIAILALLLIASFFRLHRIESQPASLWLDESLTGLNALEIIEGKSALIWQMTPLDRWRPDWVKTSNLYLHYTALVLKIFGTGYFGLKMVSLLPAIAGVGAAYFLFREMSNPVVAFLSAFLLAVSQWHVTISRWGWDGILMSFLQLLSYFYLIRGANSGRKSPFILSGALMGLCLYTYVASWIAAAIALTFLLVRAARERNRLSTGLRDLLLFLGACILVFAPLSVHYWENPGDLTVRASEVSVAKAVEETKSYFPWWENFRNYALMFNYRGDNNPRHGFPGKPVMDLVSSIFFVLGLTYRAYFWKNSHNLFLLLWFALGLVPGLLSESSSAPHAYRTFAVSPVVFLFAGGSIYFFLRAVCAWTAHVKVKNAIFVLLGIALLFSLALVNYRIYFVSRPKSPEVWTEEGRDGGLPLALKSLQAGSSMVVVDPLLLWKVVVSNHWFLTYQPGKLFESAFLPANLLMAIPALAQSSNDQPLTHIYAPVFRPMMQSLFPDAKGELVRSRFGDSLYGVLHITVGDLRLRLASVEKSRLAAVLYKTARFYQQQANADGEQGPRRELLIMQFQTGIDIARQLDPALEQDR